MKEIIDRYKNVQELRNSLSEIDIQFLLVEPIIAHAGWNLYDPREVKRAGRAPNKDEFDIEIYEPRSKDFRIAIECKSLRTEEFNIDKIKRGIGGLLPTRAEDEYKQKRQKDGVAQLRRYCIRSFIKGQNTPLPILTNGYKWVIFCPDFYKDRREYENHINEKMVLECETIESAHFKDRIIQRLKK